MWQLPANDGSVVKGIYATRNSEMDHIRARKGLSPSCMGVCQAIVA